MRRVFLAGLVAALALTGCGGDDDNNNPDQTKAEFLAQSEAVCREHAKTQDEIAASIPTNATAKEAGAVYLEQAIPDLKEQAKELQAITPPPEDEDEIDALYDDANAVIEQLEEDLQDLPEKVMSAKEDPFADVNARLKAYGFVACAQ